MSREKKKSGQKFKEQRIRHVNYQKFYDAKKSLDSWQQKEVQVEAFGYRFTLTECRYDKPGYVIIRANKGLLLCQLDCNNKLIGKKVYLTRYLAENKNQKIQMRPYYDNFDIFCAERIEVKGPKYPTPGSEIAFVENIEILKIFK